MCMCMCTRAYGYVCTPVCMSWVCMHECVCGYVCLHVCVGTFPCMCV